MNQDFRIHRRIAALSGAVALTFGMCAAAAAQGGAGASTSYGTAMGHSQNGAQTAQSFPVDGFRYPESGRTVSSELRIREIPQAPMAGGQAAVPVTDSPDSLEQYRLCQRDADRAATDIADMQGRIAACLNALNERRAQGR